MTTEHPDPGPHGPGSVTLALQLVLATAAPDRVLLDCALVEEVTLSPSWRIPAGALLTLSIEHGLDGVAEWPEHPAAALFERWCESGAVVHASVSWWSRCLVLRHDSEELLLAVC